MAGISSCTRNLSPPRAACTACGGLLTVGVVRVATDTGAVLSLTSVDAWTYAWTVFIGFIPSGIPFAYAAVVGEAVINEFPPKDPVLLSVTLLGLVATVLAVWQVGVLAASEMRKAGVRLPFGEQQMDSREMV